MYTTAPKLLINVIGTLYKYNMFRGGDGGDYL